MSSRWQLILNNVADEQKINQKVSYACILVDLQNGLHKEFRFIGANSITYLSHYMSRNIDKMAIIQLADDLIVKRMEMLQKIHNGYGSSRGKFDLRFAVALINEYISEECLSGEFEYQNFGGENEWSKPKKLDGQSEPHWTHTHNLGDTTNSKFPGYDWLFSNKTCSTQPMGRLESLYRVRQQRQIFGGPIPKPANWDYDSWRQQFLEAQGDKTPIEENAPSTKELICSFLILLDRNEYRECRIRYTNEMMDFEVPDYRVLEDEVKAMVREQGDLSNYKRFWLAIESNISISTAKYLYAMFKQGPAAIDRFEIENMHELVTNWSESGPLTNFFRYFKNTIHYETTVPVPKVEKMDPVIVQSGIDFLNKFKENGSQNPEGPMFDSRPLTEDDLFPSKPPTDSNNEPKDSELKVVEPKTEKQNAVPVQNVEKPSVTAATKSVSENGSSSEPTEKKKNSVSVKEIKMPSVTATVKNTVENGVSSNVNGASADHKEAEQPTEVKNVVSEVKLTLSYAKIVGKSAKQDTEVSKPVPQVCKPEVVETFTKPESAPPKQEKQNKNTSGKQRNQKGSEKKKGADANGWKQVESNHTDTRGQNRKKSNESIKTNGSSATQSKKSSITDSTQKPEIKKEAPVVESNKSKADVKKPPKVEGSKEIPEAESKTTSTKDKEKKEIIPSKEVETAESAPATKKEEKEEKLLPEAQSDLKKANGEDVAVDLEAAQPAKSPKEPEKPKETKTARKKAKKAAAKAAAIEAEKVEAEAEAANTLMALKSGLVDMNSPEMLRKLLMIADDDTFVEAEFDVQVKDPKSKNKKKKNKKQQQPAPKETTTVEASFTDEMATVFVNKALLAAQDIFKPPVVQSTSSSHSFYDAKTGKSGVVDPDEYVPGQTVTHDYRPGVRPQEGGSVESDSNSSNQTEMTTFVPKKMTESKGCSAGNDEDEDDDEIPSDPEASELEVADLAPPRIIERASDPSLHDMFRRLKHLANKQSNGGLRNVDHGRRSLVMKRLQRFQNIYLFRFRIAKAMLYILDIDVTADRTGLREKTVIKGLLSYIEEHVDTEPDSIRGKNLDIITEQVTINGGRETDMIIRGLRYIDTKVGELDPSDPLQKSYSAICDRVYNLMKEQEVLFKIVGSSVDFRGYENYL